MTLLDYRHPELVSGSILPRSRFQRRQAQPRRKVMPVGVFALNEVDLPLPVPVLQPFLLGDGGGHVAKQFVADEPVDPVTAGEASGDSLAVLSQALNEVGRNADIDCAVGLAGEQVDARLALEVHDFESAAGWILKQVQDDGWDCNVSGLA